MLNMLGGLCGCPFLIKKLPHIQGRNDTERGREVTKRTAPITHWQPALRAKKLPHIGTENSAGKRNDP